MPDPRKPAALSPDDPGRALESIRALMERALEYRHPPAASGLVAGVAALVAATLTHFAIERGEPDALTLGPPWTIAFAVAFLAVVAFTQRAARREGKAFWSPLALDVVHALWPPLVAALALTVALVRAQRLELVASVWLLAYGVGGIAAGAFASPVVRGLGVVFLVLGLVDSVLLLPPAIVLGASFGGLHLVYAAVVLVRDARGSDGG